MAVPTDAWTGQLPKRIWWLEVTKGRSWMRMAGVPEAIRVESTLDGSRTYYAFVAGPPGFELISRPGSTRVGGAEVTEITAGLPPMLWAVDALTVPADTAARLTAVVANATATVTSMAAARRRLRPLLESRGIRNQTQDVSAAYLVARASLARTELVTVNRADPYRVAASIIAGVDLIPGPGPIDSGLFPFTPLTPDAVRCWASSPSLGVTDLDRGTREHQLIVRQLVEACLAMGWVASYNPHVDVRIANPDAQMLFEVKTCTDATFLAQMRLGIGQLIEYAYRYRAGVRRTELCLVIEDAAPAPLAYRVCETAGIRLVVVRSGGLVGLTECVRSWAHA